MEDLTEAAVVADSEGRILYANASCESILGWPPVRLVGSSLVEIIPDRLRQAHLAGFAQQIATGAAGRILGRPLQVQARRPDGSEVTTDLLISPFETGGGRAFIGTMRPVAAPSGVDPGAAVSQALLVALSGPSDWEHIAAKVLVAIGRTLAWDAAAFWVVDDAADQLRCSDFWSREGCERFEAATRAALFPPGVGLPGGAWELGRPIWVEDLASDPNFLRTRAAAAVGLRSGVAFPLAAAGRFVGIIECFHREQRAEEAGTLAAMAGLGQLLGSFLDRGRDEEERTRLLEQVQTERGRLTTVLRGLELLAEAGEILAGSMGLDDTLSAIAQASVPRLGDACMVDLLDPQGRIRRVAMAVADPVKHEIWTTLDEAYGHDPSRAEGVARVLRTGELVVYDAVTDDDLRAVAMDGSHLALLRSLGLHASVIVPLAARGRTIGALTYVSTTRERRYSDPEIDLASELGRRTGLAVINLQLYERSREVAYTLQSSLLPPRLPEIPGLDLGACFLAGGEDLIVGGDFYDVSALDDGRWAVTIGDVCGTGAEAAAVTARVRYTARAASERSRPAALLGRVNAVLRAEADESSRFCTVVHGVLEITAEGFGATLASGGHPPPLVVRGDGQIEELSCRGHLLGVFDDVRHEEAMVTVRHGESLVLFTDGVIEARSPSGLFDDAGLHRVLVASMGRPAADMAAEVGDAVLRHGGGHTSDDVAVLVIRATPMQFLPVEAET